MNRFLFIMMLLPAGAFAQLTVSKPISDTTIRPLDARLAKAAWLAQAKRSHSTDKGTVYIMPIDNMPCLVPDLRRNRPMPTIRSKPDPRMPNGFPVMPLIPQSK